MLYESLVTKVLRELLEESSHPLRVIEIGTAYGEQLQQLRGCENLKELVSIDPMYDWVPDVKPEDQFDRDRVDAKKVSDWWKNSEGLQAWLLISKSHDAPSSGRLVGKFDVLVIDGCHHPADAVEADYWDFVPYLAHDHVAIFDDINHIDPEIASKNVVDKLIESGMEVQVQDAEGGRVRILRVSRQTDLSSHR
jgi:hypothetical protein